MLSLSKLDGLPLMQIFGEEELLSIPFKYLVFTVAGCPLSAFVICLLLSVLLHYDQVKIMSYDSSPLMA